MEENKVAADSSAPNSPDLTRLSGEQAEERTAREIRKIAEAAAKELFADKYFRETALASNNHDDHAHAQEIAAAVIEKACSRLASRVEELELALSGMVREAVVLSKEYLETVSVGLRDSNTVQGWDIARWKCAIAAKELAEKLLAGAHAEEKEPK